MYRKVKAENLPLTLGLAQQFVAMTPLPGERALRKTRRAYLIAQLLLGKFSGPDWADGFCKADGLTYRLDGQHSSELLVNLPPNTQFPDGLIATITHYEFDSLADAPDVFNLFNNPRSVRNNADMMGTYAAGVSELKGYDREFLVAVANGIHEAEMQRRKKGAKDAVLFGSRDRGLYYGYPNRPDFVAAVHWLAGFRERKNAAFLEKPVIISEMIAHCTISAALADEFWPLVFSENHPDPDHETRQLAEWFREQLAIAAKPKIDPTLFRKKALKAWRAFKVSQTVPTQGVLVSA